MKKLGILLLCAATVVMFAASLWNTPTEKEMEYYQEINTLLKDSDFFTARLSVGIITLYDAEFTTIKEIEFDSYDHKIPLIAIRRDGNSIYFITGGSVDDEYGVVFINDGSDHILDGIMSLERIGGNSYLYSTR